MRKVFFFFAAAALTLASCNKSYEISVEPTLINAPQAGGVYEISLNCNAAWTSKIDGNVNVIVDPDFGAGSAVVTLTIPENLLEEPLDGIISFTCGPDPSKMATVVVTQHSLTSVSWGGVDYPVKKMKDGNFWFTQNLRYVPEGKEVSNDLTKLDNGVWFPIDAVTKQLTDNADTVAKKGYLYSAEAALGLAPGTVNNDNFTNFSGTRGICPEGWHIPSLDEIAYLVGRVSISPYDLKGNPGPVTTAPYWNADAGTAQTALANADGFNIHNTVGYINAAATATKGTVLNIMAYILSSTGVASTKAGQEGQFNNQFYGIMVAATKGGSCEGACFNYRGGASVRCVKDVVLIR